MSYKLYAALKHSLAAGLSDVSVNAGTFARPDSEITQTTIVITTDLEPIELERGKIAGIKQEVK